MGVLDAGHVCASDVAFQQTPLLAFMAAHSGLDVDDDDGGVGEFSAAPRRGWMMRRSGGNLLAREHDLPTGPSRRAPCTTAMHQQHPVRTSRRGIFGLILSEAAATASS